MAAGLGIADLHAAPGVIRAVSPVRWLCKRDCFSSYAAVDIGRQCDQAASFTGWAASAWRRRDIPTSRSSIRPPCPLFGTTGRHMLARRLSAHDP